ncbi:hypothetical protein DYB36_014405 [Aphanomyces astaci]|uniref:SGNH hydrolase-type esterase domain-containing protein n=1 Tax=Aphanomyces astaci TaxID=112090 RepID=A0A396ZZ27_APHAT|nr:hypothetical protein DYB36_014405 [Aphanomyces astaci]
MRLALVSLCAACLALVYYPRPLLPEFPQPVDLKATTTTTTHSLPSFLFVGDSITELGSHPDLMGFQVLFQKDYVRKADTINRGNSGWTTRKWILALPTLVAEWRAKPPTLVVLFLGANDACLTTGADAWAHVPLPEYKANLNTLVRAFQTSFMHSRVLLVTPPPFDDTSIVWKDTRTNAETGRYAAAAVDVAKRANVPVVDLWTVLQPRITTIFYDGLHPNANGNVHIHSLLRQTIRTAYPDLTPDQMPVVYS